MLNKDGNKFNISNLSINNSESIINSISDENQMVINKSKKNYDKSKQPEIIDIDYYNKKELDVAKLKFKDVCYNLATLKTCIFQDGIVESDDINKYIPFDVSGIIPITDSLMAKATYSTTLDIDGEYEKQYFELCFYRNGVFVDKYEYGKAVEVYDENYIKRGFGSVARPTLSVSEKTKIIEELKPKTFEKKHLIIPDKRKFTDEELYSIYKKSLNFSNELGKVASQQSTELDIIRRF